MALLFISNMQLNAMLIGLVMGWGYGMGQLVYLYSQGICLDARGKLNLET